MDVSGTHVLRPFGTVINFNEDFHSDSEASEKIAPNSVSLVMDNSLAKKAENSTKGRGRKTKTVLAAFKSSRSSSYRFNHRSRSKSRSNNRATLGRISMSTGQLPLQKYSHFQPPVNRFSEPPLSQLSSCSPPGKDHQGSINLPSENFDHLKRTSYLVGYSNEEPRTGIMMGCDHQLSIQSVENTENNLLFTCPRTANNTKSSQIQCSSPDSHPKLKQEIEKLFPVSRVFHGRAHSCENLVRNNLQNVSSKVPLNSSNKLVTFDSEGGDKSARVKIEAYEAELKSLREQLARRSFEVEQISQELLSIKKEEKSMKSRLKNSLHTESMNEDTLLSLKNKIAELYADLESLRSAHTQSVDRQVDLQEEVSGLRRLCDWYAEHLRSTEYNRDKFHSENEKLQTLLKEREEINHRLTHENTCLQAQLVCSQAASATAKRNLSAQLDAIRIDMIEREAVFERFAAERASLEKLNLERAGQLSELQVKVGNLQTELKVAEEQMARQRDRLEYLESCVSSADLQRTELQDKLYQLEQRQVVNDQQADEKLLNYHVAMQRLENLQRVCEEKDQDLALVTEQKASLEAELTAAYKEKNVLDDYLNKLKSDLVRIEDSFDRARCELDSKHMQIFELTTQRDTLARQIKELEQQTRESLKFSAKLEHEKENLVDLVESLRAASARNPQMLNTAIQTELSPHVPNAGKSTESMDPINLNSALTRIQYNQSTPTSLTLPTHSVQIPTENSLNSPLDTNHWHATAAGVQADLVGNSVVPFAQNQSESKPTNSFGVIQNSGLSNSKIQTAEVQEVSNVPGVARFPPLDTVSSSALSSSKELSSTPTPEQNQYSASLEVSVQKSLHESMDNKMLISITPVPATGQGESNFSTIPIQSTAGVNTVANTVMGSEEVELSLRSQEITVHPTDCTHNYSFNDCDRHSNTVFSNDCSSENQMHLNSMQFTTNVTGLQLGQSGQSKAWISDGILTSQCEPHSERVALPSLNALPAQWASCQPKSLNPKGDFSTNHTYEDLDDQYNRKQSDVVGVFNGSQAHKDTSLKRLNAKDNLHCDSELSMSVGPSDLLGNGEASFSLFDGVSNEINDQAERATILKALDMANQRAAEAFTNLIAARHEADQQTATANREAIARQEAATAHQQAVVELNATKMKLNDLRLELDSVRSQTQSLREESASLRALLDLRTSAHANELEALRTIVKTTTDHLALMSISLKKSNEKKSQLQKELAHIKGCIRAQLERFRLFSSTKSSANSDPLGASVGEESQSVAAILASIGLDVQTFEALLGESTSLPILNSKPLKRLDKCFDALQSEISNLEDQLVQHAIAVRGSTSDSLKADDEGIPVIDGEVPVCDREP